MATIVLGAAVAVVGVFLYRRSGRDWTSDVQLAKDWLDNKTDDAQKVLDRADRATRELMANAEELKHKATGAAHGAYEAVRERVS